MTVNHEVLKKLREAGIAILDAEINGRLSETDWLNIKKQIDIILDIKR